MHAVGPAYTEWEGYLEEGSGRAVIGLSYDKLCRDVKPGGRILLADGSITIQVGVGGFCGHWKAGDISLCAGMVGRFPAANEWQLRARWHVHAGTECVTLCASVCPMMCRSTHVHVGALVHIGWDRRWCS